MSPSYAIEFLIWVMIAASVIAVLAARLKIPYTVALVLGGLALGSVHLPLLDSLIGERPEWLTPNAALILFLPPLLFEGSLKLQARHLRENLAPILLLASVGVLVATLITGLAMHWLIALPLLTSLVFGAIVSATDPISVLAIFKDMAVTKRLSVIVEGESLLNDGTAAVLFGILLAGSGTGRLSVRTGLQDFLIVVLGGAALGVGVGYLASKITQTIDDPPVEITLTVILAYGSYLAAQSLQLSGAIATVAAGLMMGNFGAKVGMSPRSRIALWSFWEYASFVINSVVFLLIGLQVHIGDLFQAWQATLVAVGAVLIGRMLSVYALLAVSGLLAEKISFRWQHVLVWGGLRGALSLALALSLGSSFPYRTQILAMTFGVVAFTIIVQGLTIKPLLYFFRITNIPEDEIGRARVRKMAITSARAELDALLRGFLIAVPAYERLRQELDARLEQVNSHISAIYAKNEPRIRQEVEIARSRLIAAEKSSIEQSLHEGLISRQTAAAMIDDANRRQEEIELKSQGEACE